MIRSSFTAHLMCFKGVPEDYLDDYVSDLIRELSLEEYADKAAGGYSGGNKRKLSVGNELSTHFQVSVFQIYNIFVGKR